MKKSLFALTLAIASVASFAADSVSLEVARVSDNDTNAHSQTQTLRVGKDVGALALGLQVRTAVADAGGLGNSIEGTVGSAFGPVQLFGGLGHDNGLNGARGGAYQYGLVGASVGSKLGALDLSIGVKTRVNWESQAPDQTVAFVSASLPLTKNLSATATLSRSYQDIREDSFGLGLKLAF